MAVPKFWKAVFEVAVQGFYESVAEAVASVVFLEEGGENVVEKYFHSGASCEAPIELGG